MASTNKDIPERIRPTLVAPNAPTETIDWASTAFRVGEESVILMGKLPDVRAFILKLTVFELLSMMTVREDPSMKLTGEALRLTLILTA